MNKKWSIIPVTTLIALGGIAFANQNHVSANNVNNNQNVNRINSNQNVNQKTTLVNQPQTGSSSTNSNGKINISSGADVLHNRIIQNIAFNDNKQNVSASSSTSKSITSTSNQPTSYHPNNSVLPLVAFASDNNSVKSNNANNTSNYSYSESSQSNVRNIKSIPNNSNTNSSLSITNASNSSKLTKLDIISDTVKSFTPTANPLSNNNESITSTKPNITSNQSSQISKSLIQVQYINNGHLINEQIIPNADNHKFSLDSSHLDIPDGFHFTKMINDLNVNNAIQEVTIQVDKNSNNTSPNNSSNTKVSDIINYVYDNHVINSVEKVGYKGDVINLNNKAINGFAPATNKVTLNGSTHTIYLIPSNSLHNNEPTASNDKNKNIGKININYVDKDNNNVIESSSELGKVGSKFNLDKITSNIPYLYHFIGVISGSNINSFNNGTQIINIKIEHNTQPTTQTNTTKASNSNKPITPNSSKPTSNSNNSSNNWYNNYFHGNYSNNNLGGNGPAPIPKNPTMSNSSQPSSNSTASNSQPSSISNNNVSSSSTTPNSKPTSTSQPVSDTINYMYDNHIINSIKLTGDKGNAINVGDNISNWFNPVSNTKITLDGATHNINLIPAHQTLKVKALIQKLAMFNSKIRNLENRFY